MLPPSFEVISISNRKSVHVALLGRFSLWQKSAVLLTSPPCAYLILHKQCFLCLTFTINTVHRRITLKQCMPWAELLPTDATHLPHPPLGVFRAYSSHLEHLPLPELRFLECFIHQLPVWVSKLITDSRMPNSHCVTWYRKGSYLKAATHSV